MPVNPKLNPLRPDPDSLEDIPGPGATSDDAAVELDYIVAMPPALPDEATQAAPIEPQANPTGLDLNGLEAGGSDMMSASPAEAGLGGAVPVLQQEAMNSPAEPQAIPPTRPQRTASEGADADAPVDEGRSVNGVTLTTSDRDDAFWFNPGEANGVTIADFSAGDMLVFSNFGTTGQGATFTQIGTTNQWTVHSGLDGHDEVITISNGHVFQPSEYLFFLWGESFALA